MKSFGKIWSKQEGNAYIVKVRAAVDKKAPATGNVHTTIHCSENRTPNEIFYSVKPHDQS